MVVKEIELLKVKTSVLCRLCNERRSRALHACCSLLSAFKANLRMTVILKLVGMIAPKVQNST